MKARNRNTPQRSQAGFTFVELLAAILVLSLVTAVVAAGVPAAFGAYSNTVDASNAQSLFSTATERLRAELSVAKPDSVSAAGAAGAEGDGVLVAFDSYETGLTTKITRQGGELFLAEPSSISEVGALAYDDAVPLVSKAAVGGEDSGFVVAADGIRYDEASGCFEVSNLRVERDGHVFGDAHLDKFWVKAIAA